MSENPFEVLRLAPDSSEEEVVRQAGRLRRRAADEEARDAVRRAVQALTASADQRLLHALLAHPRPTHLWPALEKLASAFRRAPASAGPPAPCPPLDLDEVRELLRQAAAAGLEWQPLPFAPVPGGEEPDEVRRQTAEALWQSLLFDPGA